MSPSRKTQAAQKKAQDTFTLFLAVARLFASKQRLQTTKRSKLLNNYSTHALGWILFFYSFSPLIAELILRSRLAE